MVHEKYIKRGNKIFGPYLYENYRIGGVTKTRYLGKAKNFGSRKSKKKNNNRLWVNKKFFVGVGIFSLVVLALLSYSLFYSGLTGRVTLGVTHSYILGENLTGDLKIGLKSGELLPINSKIVIEHGNFVKEILLSEIVGSNFEGDFYAEGSELTGFGQGYGFVGEKKIYPDVFFTLRVSDLEKAESTGGTGEVEEVVEEEIEEIEEREEVVSEEEGAAPEEIMTEESVVPEEIIEEATPEEETPSEIIEEAPSESQESSEEVSEPVESSGESSEPESSESETSSITGEAVKGNEKFVDGICSRDNDFVYALDEGKTASVKKNSVEVEILKGDKIKKEKISDSEVKLIISGNEAKVSTEYSIVEEGFGEEFLQEEKYFIEINFDDFGILAEKGDLVVSLVYDEIVLVEASEKISVSGGPEENATEINETIINETEVDETIPELNVTINETNVTIEINITNETIELNVTNVTGVGLNDNISTVQYGAVLGKPVKWKKNIKLDEPRNLRVEIPKEAVNITVYKLNEIISEEVPEENVSVSLEVSESSGEVPEEVIENKTVEAIKNETKEVEIQKTAETVNETEIVSETDSEAVKNKEQKIEKSNKTRQKINAQVVSGKVSVELELEKRGFIMSFFKRIFSAFTGKVVEVQDTEEIKEVVIEENATEFEIEYVTPGPVAVEEEISAGKRVVISSETHYENILAYAELGSAVPEEQIKLYNVVNGSRVAVEFVGYEEEEVSTIAGDLDDGVLNETSENSTIEIIENVEEVNQGSLITGNVVENVSVLEGASGNESTSDEVRQAVEDKIVKEKINQTSKLVKRIEWIVASLSNQTYEIIIEITKAEHLDENRSFISDIYEDVKALDGNWSEPINDSEYVRVVFEQNLTSDKDITIYPRISCGAGENITINGIEIPCEIYEKKRRIDEIRGELE